MPLPTTSQVHVDTPLTNISIGYKNTMYIADDIFPIVPVSKQTDIVPEVLQSYFFKNDAVRRTPGTEVSTGGFRLKTSNTYSCPEYAWGFRLLDTVRDNAAGGPFEMERLATEYVTQVIQMAREYQCANTVFAGSTWGTNKTVAVDFTAWSTYATSTPLVDIETWKDEVMGKIAMVPNACAMGNQVWIKLKWHPDLVDSIKYTQVGIGTEALFKEATGLDYVNIGKGIYTTSAEVATGTTAAGTDQETLVSYSRIWGKNFLLFYRPASASLMTPAAGYTLVWQRVPNAIQYIKRIRDDKCDCDIIQAHSYFTHKLLATNAGLYAASAVA